jgi:hypothetical protein
MEALIDFLRSFASDEAGLRNTVVVVVAATIFIFGLGITVLVAAFTNPVRRRLGLINEKPAKDGRLAIRIATAVGPVAAYVLPKESDPGGHQVATGTTGLLRSQNTAGGYPADPGVRRRPVLSGPADGKRRDVRDDGSGRRNARAKLHIG